MTDIKVPSTYIVLNHLKEKDYWEVAHGLEDACDIYNKMWNATKPPYDTVTLAAVVASTDYDSHPLLRSLKPELNKHLDPAFTGENE